MKKIIIALFICLTVISGAFAANLSIKSDSQHYKSEENKIKFTGNVVVDIDDVTIEGPRAEALIDPKENKITETIFYDNPVAFQNDKNKRSEIKANIMKMSLLTKVITAEGNTKTTVTEPGKPTTIITAAKQEYDTKTKIVKSSGNVVVLHDDIKATSDTGYAYLDKNNEVEKVQLTGKARIVKGQNEENIVEGHNLTYNLKSEIAIATGNTFTKALMDDGSILKVWAGLQQYNKKANIVMASRAVKVIYKEYIATGPKATVYPEKITNKLNEVIFLGRSKIVTEGRSIEADRIKMILNPKNFFADGHVKTLIPNVGDLNED